MNLNIFASLSLEYSTLENGQYRQWAVPRDFPISKQPHQPQAREAWGRLASFTTPPSDSQSHKPLPYPGWDLFRMDPKSALLPMVVSALSNPYPEVGDLGNLFPPQGRCSGRAETLFLGQAFGAQPPFGLSDSGPFKHSLPRLTVGSRWHWLLGC